MNNNNNYKMMICMILIQLKIIQWLIGNLKKILIIIVIQVKILWSIHILLENYSKLVQKISKIEREKNKSIILFLR